MTVAEALELARDVPEETEDLMVVSIQYLGNVESPQPIGRTAEFLTVNNDTHPIFRSVPEQDRHWTRMSESLAPPILPKKEEGMI